MLLSTRKYVSRTGSFPKQADTNKTRDSPCWAVPWNFSPWCHLLHKTSIAPDRDLCLSKAIEEPVAASAYWAGHANQDGEFNVKSFLTPFLRRRMRGNTVWDQCQKQWSVVWRFVIFVTLNKTRLCLWGQVSVVLTCWRKGVANFPGELGALGLPLMGLQSWYTGEAFKERNRQPWGSVSREQIGQSTLRTVKTTTYTILSGQV